MRDSDPDMSVAELSDAALLDRISEQEARVVFSAFSMKMAQDIGLALREVGNLKNLPIAIDVTRNGQCLFHCALEGATPDNAHWIRRKNRVVQRFGHSSLYMGVFCRTAGYSLEDKFLLPANEFAAHGGAFPIAVSQTGIVGTVTVSGLPQIEDHELVVSVLDKFL